MSTQYGEDAIILKHFAGRTGRFLDVGAGDGITFSNTRPLFALGWKGVCVEPAPSQLRWLYENYDNSDEVQICPCAVGELAKISGVPFWDARDFSTTSLAHRDIITARSQGKIKFRDRRVIVVSWWELLGIHPGPYDFVNIDVEGTNCELLASMPFNSVRPEMVCIEIDPAYQLTWMGGTLAAAGLSKQEVCGGNLLAWK